MTELKLGTWLVATALLAAVCGAQNYPACPFTGLPPTKPNWTLTRCLDAAQFTCCKDCSDSRYALAEVSANVTTLISTVDPNIGKLLANKDVQLCSSFVNNRQCQDLLEQMICATGCNPDSGNYLDLPPNQVGEMRVCSAFAQVVYDTCKDLPLPGFQGAISTYFNSAEKFMTTLFGKVGAAFDAINYTVRVTPTDQGTGKCYNGPRALPKIGVCCDPLPATSDCPLAKLNVTMNPEYKPFVNRTIADRTCANPATAGGSGSGTYTAPASSTPAGTTGSTAAGGSPPPPPKAAGSIDVARVVHSALALATAAGFMLL